MTMRGTVPGLFTGLVAVPLVAGCNETTVCPAVAVAALRITLENLPAAECPKATVDVRDGAAYSETVNPRMVDGACEARAAVERTGTFSVTVRASGRPTRTWSGVEVEADPSCGTPITRFLTVSY